MAHSSPQMNREDISRHKKTDLNSSFDTQAQNTHDSPKLVHMFITFGIVHPVIVI